MNDLVCLCPAYPFPHRMYGGECEGLDPDEECEHGYPAGEYCPQCEIEEEGDRKYHALKENGLI